MCLEGLSREPWASGVSGIDLLSSGPATSVTKGLFGAKIQTEQTLDLLARRLQVLQALYLQTLCHRAQVVSLNETPSASPGQGGTWESQRRSFCGSVIRRQPMLQGHLGIIKAGTHHSFCLRSSAHVGPLHSVPVHLAVLPT